MPKHSVDPQPAHSSDSSDFPGNEQPIEYSRLSPADRRFLEELDAVPLIGTLSVEQERERMRAGQTATTADYPVEVQAYQTSACTVHLIRPAEIEAPAPVVFYLHGGGWVLGDLRTHMKLVCELSLLARCVVAFIEYPCAPEHPFPAPLDACVTALTEVLQTAASLGLDKNRYALAGDSSGANLAAALILCAIERDLPLPVRQVLLYPATDYNSATPSYRQFAGNPNLSQFTMKWFWDMYVPEKSFAGDPRVSPLCAARDALMQFPPTLIITSEYDVLRDEGEQFATRLIGAGADVTVVRWLGALHGFMVTESLAVSTSAQACVDLVAQYISRGFARQEFVNEQANTRTIAG